MTPLLKLSALFDEALDLDDLVRFHTDRHNHSRTDIRAAPALTAAPELQTDVKLVVPHACRRTQSSARARSAARWSDGMVGRSLCPSRGVNQTPTFPLDQQERKKDLPPILNGAVHAPDLQAILRLVNLQPLIAAATPEYVAGRSPALRLTVANPDLGLPETHCVIDPV
jgi:hypothetical protein